MKRKVLHFVAMPARMLTTARYFWHQFRIVLRWLWSSREQTNFTYHLTSINRRYLAHFLGIVCNQEPSVMAKYISEIELDAELREHLIRCTRNSKLNYVADDEPRYARRIGWYAIVRATRPSVVIETGVDKGLGSCILAAALKRNASEGFPGRYYGTDINPKAGYLLQAPYDEFGEIIYGDSIKSLLSFDTTIDLFINDSDHSIDYEMREFEAIANKLSKNAIILGDNSHFSEKLVDFANQTGRSFLFFQEQPESHWYPGGGIGAAYRRH